MTELEDYSNTACIVYPVEFPKGFTAPVDAHSTIVFLGDVDEQLEGIGRQDILTVLSDLTVNTEQWVEVDSMAMFGPNYNIPVLKLFMTSYMLAVHDAITDELATINVHSVSEFAYVPHVTMESENDPIPPRVLIQRPVLWWREYSFPIGIDTRLWC